MNFVLIFILFIYTCIKVFLNYIEIVYIKKTQDNKAVILSEENFKKAAKYKIANEKFALFSGLYDFLLLTFWLLFGLVLLENFLQTFNGTLKTVLFVMIFLAINYIFMLPFDIYNVFRKDKKFGFSTIDVKTFVLDQLKGALIFIVFVSILVTLLSIIMEKLLYWWIWGFVLIFSLLILINLIYPTFIAPLFNKFKPLEDEDLKSSINLLLQKAGLNSDGVFTIDASKRDKRLNAFFAGLGKSKRVVLYDTLLEKVSKSELLAVLGHELGHFKHKDIIKKIALMGLTFFALFALFGNLPLSVYEALGLEAKPYALIVFFMMFSPVAFFIITPILSFFSRLDEYRADEYGSKCESKEALSSALMKLADENKSYPHSHPLNVIFYHSHPPLVKRLEALGVNFSED